MRKFLILCALFAVLYYAAVHYAGKAMFEGLRDARYPTSVPRSLD